MEISTSFFMIISQFLKRLNIKKQKKNENSNIVTRYVRVNQSSNVSHRYHTPAICEFSIDVHIVWWKISNQQQKPRGIDVKIR